MGKTQNKPGSIRIFKNPVLESFTHVHPIIPLLLWGPVSFYWLVKGSHGLSFNEMVFWPLAGIFIWTFTEYTLHRFLFHFPAKSRFAKRLVFLFHGLHHDDPDDATRLVMPPVPAILIVTILYFLFSLIIPANFLLVFMCGFMTGYLIYDYIHYATHHFKMTSRPARYLKKFHLQHHHAKDECKFGVSSPLWDYIFGTLEGKK